jgi:tetratricopeptide (TPR) repeat protein
VSEDKKTIVKMAHIYSQEGRWDKAIAEYKKLIKLDPEDFNSFSMLGDVLVKKGELQPAFDAYFVCSDAYIRLGQLEKAALVQSKIARLSSDALNADSKAKQAVFQKQVEGDKAMDGGDIDAAIKSYQTVLGMDPDRFDLYQKLGDLYLRKGEIDQACRKYLEIGDIYFRNKLIKKAAPIYLKVVELDPENVDAHAALADIQAKSGNESEAKKELLLLAEFLFQRGDLDRCYQFAQKGEQLKSIESYNYLGHVELRRGKRAEARAWFEKLLKFKLNHGGALWGLGLVQAEEGKPDDAMKTWARVPNSDRFYGETLEAMGAVLAGKGKNAEAAKHYQDAAAALRSKGMAEAAKAATAKASELLGGALPEEAPAPVPVAQSAPPPVEEAPQPAPAAPAPLPAPVAQAPAAPPPLPVVAAQSSAGLPPLPDLPENQSPEAGAEDDMETLLALADNFEAEGAFDEAIDVYQRVLAQDAGHARAKDGLSRAYRMLAGGPAQAAPAPSPAAGQDDELAQLAARKAEAEAEKRQAEEAARKLAEERSRAEEEARQAAAARAQAEAAAKKLDSERSTAEALAKAAAESKLRAETELRLRAEIEARQKAEADAKRQAADAAAQAEAMHKRIEAEIRAQLEDEMRRKVEVEAQARADADVAKKVEAARQAAEADARVKAEAEIRRQFEAERKKLEHEQSEVKQRKEDELRRDISAKVEVEQKAETDRKVEAVRVHEQDEANKRKTNDVLARVAAQQKEKMAPLQRTIDEIRRKVEERAAQNSGAAQASNSAPSAPVPAQPLAAKAASDDGDEMDDFMTAAVADIYVKQGLVDEAKRIYERILRREPGNGEVREKLALLEGKAPAAAEPDAKAADPVKKSKVSYL